MHSLTMILKSMLSFICPARAVWNAICGAAEGGATRWHSNHYVLLSIIYNIVLSLLF